MRKTILVFLFFLFFLESKSQDCQIGFLDSSINILNSILPTGIRKYIDNKDESVINIILINKYNKSDSKSVYFLQFDSVRIVRSLIFDTDTSAYESNQVSNSSCLKGLFPLNLINGYYQGFCNDNPSNHEISILAVFNSSRDIGVAIYAIGGDLDTLLERNESTLGLLRYYSIVKKVFKIKAY